MIKKESLFLKLFPPPKFMTMPAVGLDISGDSIKIVSLRRKSGNFRLEYFDSITLKPGALEDGNIKEPAIVSSALAELKKKYNFEFASISIPEERVFVFEIEMPCVPEDNIRQAVEFKLEENVPFPAKDILFDYSILPESNKERLHIGVSAVTRGLIESYIDVLSKNNIIPVGFETASRAISRAVISPTDPRASLVVDFSKKSTMLCVAHGDFAHFSTTVSIGSEMVNEAVAKTFNVSAEKALDIKEKLSTSNESSKIELFDSVFNTISALRDEIDKVLVYWSSKVAKEPGMHDISRIILCGQDSNLPGFQKYVRLTTKKRVEMANVWTNIFDFQKDLPEMPFEKSLDYACAIGLALNNK